MIFTTATNEDAKHLIEEIWDVDSDDLFCKMLARENKKGFIKLPRHSKAELKELSST